MNLDEIEDLIRRYLSAGIAVVLILIAPGGGEDGTAPRDDDPAVLTVDPSADPTTPPRTPRPRTPEDGTDADTETPGPGTPAPDADLDSDLDARGPAGGAEPGLDDEDPRPSDPEGADTADEDTATDDTTTDAPTRTGDRDTGGDDTGDEETGDEDTGDDSASATGADPTTTRAPADPASTSRSATGTAPSAAEALGWGTPDREDDFSSGLARWELYQGPGHAGQGVRSPEAATVRDGVLTLTGDASGTTAGMSWGQGQRYGRWEGRVRAPASDPSYDALLLLWPDAEDFPVGGEIDFMEMQDPTRQRTDFFLHHGADDEQVRGQVEVDATQWHNWAVEWTPDAITAFVDGEQWFRTTDTATFPPGPMHLCIQLDWFPEGPGPVQQSTMEVDWVRQYALDGP
ncbi:family 16 glycosylhydrolase [Pseudonocardia saturnea]